MSQAEYHSEENLLVKTPVLSLILGSWEIHSTTLRLCLQLLNGTKMVLQIGSTLNEMIDITYVRRAEHGQHLIMFAITVI